MEITQVLVHHLYPCCCHQCLFLTYTELCSIKGVGDRKAGKKPNLYKQTLQTRPISPMSKANCINGVLPWRAQHKIQCFLRDTF